MPGVLRGALRAEKVAISAETGYELAPLHVNPGFPMSAEPEQKTTPPYASHTSYVNYLDHLRTAGSLPTRIDKSVMSHLNYGTQQALVATLRYLELIDTNDAPTMRLEMLVKAPEEKRAELTLTLLETGYPYLFDGSLDLSRATPAELEERIRAEGGIAGSTVHKAIAFFLAAAGTAGIPLSPHLTKRKPAAGGNGRRLRGKTRRQRAVDDEMPQRPVSQAFADPWLSKFPDFNPSWPPDIQAKWFDGFEHLMKTRRKVGS